MKSTHENNGIPISFIHIKFYVCALHIEIAIISLLIKSSKATKKLIKQELVSMFRSGGVDGAGDWVSEQDQETYIVKARAIAKYLYPTFYQLK